MRKKNKKGRILVISDLQIPYQHPDSLAFLKAVKRKYAPLKRVVQIGDLLDLHCLTSYLKDPSFDTPKLELEKGFDFLQKLVKLFPKVIVTQGNHEDRLYKKAQGAGICKSFLKNFNDLYDLPNTWKFVFDYREDGFRFTHNLTSKSPQALIKHGESTVQGHHHTELFVHSWVDQNYVKKYGVVAGCLIDDKKAPFNYQRRNVLRPNYGLVLIENGVPKIIPMEVDKNRRWTGVIR